MRAYYRLSTRSRWHYVPPRSRRSKAKRRGSGRTTSCFMRMPRRKWGDRVALEIKPQGDGRIMVDPFPFDEAPLLVTVPARVAEPQTWWQQAPWILKEFTFHRK